MKLKILYLILFILIFMPIGLCEKIEDIKELNNTKIYYENNKTIDIYDKNEIKIMDIKLISTISDIDKFIEIFEITNYKTYIPNEKKDFITKHNVKFGNNIYKTEFYIYKNISNCNEIKINKTIFNNKTKRNETIIINKTICFNNKNIWVKYNPYNKTIYKNEKQIIKIIYYKKPELGFFKIQTIPIFRNVECKELTWWDGNWNLKRPILINNTYGDNVIDYQLKSINLSEYQINASSARIINESSGLIQNHWNETIDDNGNLEYVWCNYSKINNGSWINSTYYIYYQSISIVDYVSNGNNTFIQYHSYAILPYHDNNIITTPLIYESKVKRTNDGQMLNGISEDENMNAVLGDAASIMFDPNDNKNYFKTFNEGSQTYSYEAPTIINNTFYCLKIVLISGTDGHAYINENELNIGHSSNIPIDENLGLSLEYSIGGSGYQLWSFIRQYTINEPELWTVGNIEYPEGLNMTCNIKIISHLTEKNIEIVNMTGHIINESTTNKCINLTYDSYLVYMSNPIKVSTFTELLNILDNVLIQFLLFIFLIVIGTLFYVFIQIVKKKGFKL